MIRFNSAELTADQAEDEPINVMNFENRSDEWWDKFWMEMGLALMRGDGV